MLLEEICPSYDDMLEEDLGKIKNALGAFAIGAGAALSSHMIRDKEPEQTQYSQQASSVEIDSEQAFRDHDKRLLALTMWGEARSHGEKGMRAVGHVIMNRVNANKKKFGGNTIEGVVKKDKQFSAWNEFDSNRKAMMNVMNLDSSSPDFKAWEKALKIADEIVSGRSKDPTGGALFYHTTGVKPFWSKNKKPHVKIANHVFYSPDMIS